MTDDRNHLWATIAAGREIAGIRQMEAHKIGKPGSPYSISVLKVCSILKGAGKGYIIPSQALDVIRDASKHLGLSDNEIDRIFNRAMKTALPRFPKED